MIRMTMMCTDEAFEAKLLDCLHDENDLIIDGSIVIRNLAHEPHRALDFLNKILESPPDIAIMDLDILREAAALYWPQVLEFVRKCVSTRGIIIGERFHEQSVITMMKGRVRGFLLRDQLSTIDIIKCIHVVARGEVWLSAELVGRVCDELIRDGQKKLLLQSPTSNQLVKMKAISRREMEILELVSESMTNDEIAQKLFLSAKTVKTHVRNIFEKAGIRNRVEAALLYTRYRQEARI